MSVFYTSIECFHFRLLALFCSYRYFAVVVAVLDDVSSPTYVQFVLDVVVFCF